MPPKNAFVAGFVGEPPINFFDCGWVGERRWGSSSKPEAGFAERLHAAAQAIGEGGLAAIRPHFLSIEGDSRCASTARSYHGRVADQNLIFVDVGDTRFTLVAHPSVTPSARGGASRSTRKHCCCSAVAGGQGREYRRVSYDYIVVAAERRVVLQPARIAGEHGARVLVLEAGPDDRNPLIRMPAGFVKLLGVEKYMWFYKSVAQARLGGPKAIVPQGRVSAAVRRSTRWSICAASRAATTAGRTRSVTINGPNDALLPYFNGHGGQCAA